jgi:hypothetical protein
MTTRAIAQEIDAEIERLELLEADDLAARMRLPEWGYYARTHDLGLGYGKQITSQFRAKGWDATTDLKARIPRIPDDEAVAIDRAIGSLGQPYIRAIHIVYKDLFPYRQLPRSWQKVVMVAIGKLSMVLPYE